MSYILSLFLLPLLLAISSAELRQDTPIVARHRLDINNQARDDESITLISIKAANLSSASLEDDDIVPQTQLILVDFYPVQQLAQKVNNTKQSQEFEIDNNVIVDPITIPTHNGSLPSGLPTIQAQNVTDEPNSNTPSGSTTAIVVTSPSVSTPSSVMSNNSVSPASSVALTNATTITSTTSTTTPAPSTSSVDVQTPVASRITRQGDQVHCGEANKKGNSDEKLAPLRIIGGRKSDPGEFPFQVRLNIKSKRGSGICGGVIMDDRHILTAAHCMTACVSRQLVTVTITTDEVQAIIGDHSIRYEDGESKVELEKITPHEKYDACNFYANDHDIAILRTKEKINYKFTSDGYGSVNRPCLPLKNQVYSEGEPVLVSGWGVTRENSGSLSNVLRYVQVPIVSVARCKETYGSRVTNDHICAGLESGGKDSCQGDSGGPLVRVFDNRYQLVGIVSFGYGCGQPGAPGVYTNVANYMDWVEANL